MLLPEKLHLCLVCDTPQLKEAVEACCPAPHEVRFFSLAGILNGRGEPTPLLDEIEEAAGESEAVLVAWHLQQAPLIGMLSYRLRRVPAPLIALCEDAIEEQVAALVVGADDVISLPIPFSLLQAQIFAHLRSRHSVKKDTFPITLTSPPIKESKSPVSSPDVLQYGNLRLDKKRYQLYVENKPIKVTPRQFELLRYLMENHNVLVSRDQILEHVWQIDFDTGTNMVDVYIHFLRRLLEGHGGNVSIETVRGKGYRFSVPDPNGTQNS